MRSPPSSFALISSENEEKTGALLSFCIGVQHLPTPEKLPNNHGVTPTPTPKSLGRYTPDGEG